AADDAQRVEDLARMLEVTTENQRGDEVGDDMPRGVVGLGAVVRIRVGHAFTESRRAVLVDRHEQERSIVYAAEARFEETDQREPEKTQLDAFDPHRTMLSQSAESAILR